VDNQTTVTEKKTAYSTPETATTQQVVSTRVDGDPVEFSIVKTNQIIWYIIGLINVIIILRFILLLLGAGNSGFVSFIYSLSGIFVRPFFGIFGTTRLDKSIFEAASICAIFAYTVLGFVINGFIDLFSKKTQ
jgi:hypothetical protein